MLNRLGQQEAWVNSSEALFFPASCSPWTSWRQTILHQSFDGFPGLAPPPGEQFLAPRAVKPSTENTFASQKFVPSDQLDFQELVLLVPRCDLSFVEVAPWRRWRRRGGKPPRAEPRRRLLLQAMGCFRFRCFSSKVKKGKGQESRDGPAAPASASFPSTVSTGARSNLSFSTASSAVGTSLSEDSSSAAARAAAASKSTGSASVSSARSIPELYEERGADSLREFGFRELRAATSDFSRLLKVGEGGFGSVYKGVVRLPGGPAGGTVVAIKKLNPHGHQGHKQWLAEVHFLGVVEHPNLVKLIGYCAAQSERGPQRLLVYEFMSNKTLDDHLFNKAYPVLPWDIRLEIALGAAEGLMYLHEGLEVQVIYRDFKASNVLLDEEFRAKLSDFGLAREGPSADHTHVSTAVMGTLGYAAPDYVETGHLTTKSDVWSFGVVLYEILTGRRSMERNRPKKEQKLLEWAKQYPVESKQFSKIIDTRLEGHYSKQGTRKIAKLANSCLAKNRRDRPTMREVIESLKQAMQHKELNGDAGASGESSPPDEVSGTPTTEDVAVASARRRMLHLAALGENANSIAKRRFMLMRAAAAPTPT